MSLIRLIVFSIFIYLVLRLIGRIFSQLTGGPSSRVKGHPSPANKFRNKADIEDADYEELDR